MEHVKFCSIWWLEISADAWMMLEAKNLLLKKRSGKHRKWYA